MSQPSPTPTVPPELLARDSLPALLAHLRANRSPDLSVDLTGLPRLPTPVVQALLSASLRGGVRLRLHGASPALAEGLRLLGLAAVLPVEGAAP